MLRNLQEIHRTQQDWPMLVAVLTRLGVLLPQALEIYRDRGLAYADWGVTEMALQDLERYRQGLEGPERVYIDKRIAELRRELD